MGSAYLFFKFLLYKMSSFGKVLFTLLESLLTLNEIEEINRFETNPGRDLSLYVPPGRTRGLKSGLSPLVGGSKIF
jgi:hypothetical protein